MQNHENHLHRLSDALIELSSQRQTYLKSLEVVSRMIDRTNENIESQKRDKEAGLCLLETLKEDEQRIEDETRRESMVSSESFLDLT